MPAAILLGRIAAKTRGHFVVVGHATHALRRDEKISMRIAAERLGFFRDRG